MSQDTVAIRKGTTYIFPESACILAADSGGCIVLVEQFRRPRAQWTLELPGGAVGAEEDPLVAAVREFKEETGLLPREPRFIFTLDLDLSTTLHRTHVFAAKIEGVDENITSEHNIFRVRVSDAILKIKDGSITHAPTVAAMLAIALESESGVRF